MYQLIPTEKYLQLLADSRNWQQHMEGELNISVYLTLMLILAMAGLIIFAVFLRHAEAENKFLHAENKRINAHADAIERLELTASTEKAAFTEVVLEGHGDVT